MTGVDEYLGKGDITQYSCQDIIEIMGNATGEDTEGFELLAETGSSSPGATSEVYRS